MLLRHMSSNRLEKLSLQDGEKRNCELLAETAPENQKWKFCHESSEGPIRLGSHGEEVSFVVFVDQLWVDDDRIDEFVMIDFNACSHPFLLSWQGCDF